jgi:hypothetical protein
MRNSPRVTSALREEEGGPGVLYFAAFLAAAVTS